MSQAISNGYIEVKERSHRGGDGERPAHHVTGGFPTRQGARIPPEAMPFATRASQVIGPEGGIP